jgi:chromosome segregation ATPase
VKSLSQEEIKQRLIRLNNLENLYKRSKGRINFLEKENKELKTRIKELEDRNKDLSGKIEVLSFQFEQIKNKLFGKKPIVNRIIQDKEKTRDTSSYRRPIPENITKTKLHTVHECTHCKGELKRRAVKVFFEEDIPLLI